MNKPRIYTMSFSSVYPHYVAKAERKNRTKAEVDQIIEWLTGYNDEGLQQVLDNHITVEAFFLKAPMLNPKRTGITGVICGVRIEDITDPIMKEVRYLDKLIDELAKGRSLQKIFRD